MNIDQTFTVNASRERTAAFFCDIEQVSGCIPGVEGVREVEGGEYEATLAVRLGPIRAAFQGSLALDETEAPARLRAHGRGRDRATGSLADVDFTADLTELEAGVTTVSTVAEVKVRGKLGQFGSGVMRAAATEIVREFAGCADARLAAAGAEVGAASPAPDAAAPARRGLPQVVLRGLVRSWVTGLRRLADRLEGWLAGSGAAR